MQKNCKQCQTQFEITNEDLKFYEKISPVFNNKKYLIPEPTLCPNCRQQRRLAIRNERKLYHRKSDLTGKQIISMYSPDKPFKVYDQEEWWSDKWDGLEYGMDFDFTKTLAEQLEILYQKVPHVSLFTSNVENSYYTNFALNQRNCYLLFGASNDEDCLYGKFVISDKDCVDILSVFSSELCYEGIASEGCYNCKFFENCKNCTDCIMVEDCINCKNCIGCFGLNSKEYYVFNKFVGKEKFEQIKKDAAILTHSKISFLKKKLAELKKTLPHIQSRIIASENCTGDIIFNCKNCFYAFDTKDCEDCKFIFYTPKSKESYDCTFNSPGGVEFCYNLCSSQGVKTSIATFMVWYSDNIFYSLECHNSSNLFACVGLKRKKYCILNKQYAKEEYERLVPKIIEHMVKTGEWGEYFPYNLSPFGYNETIASEHFSLEEKQALALGTKWYNEKIEANYQGQQINVPENIHEVEDSICQKILQCEVTGKPYKIIPEELKFYRRMGLPIPKKCPDQRHFERLENHKSFMLWPRKCAKCNIDIQTIYAPSRPEIVYCQKCYLQTVY